ncbi:sucrose-6-phosphate hydrolase-like, partial [Helicoverpa zea]|uniref:sucrose-6-phosphate hydrolase-like n=1 Tax=Helicoverpa zea TaxID=7113 RepID=UPI001F59163F
IHNEDSSSILSDIQFIVTALACELKETNEEIKSKRLVEEYINKTRPVVLANPRYRLHYHIAPPVGWINDPAGFTYYKENYHVFYEYNPFNTSYGKTHWGHVISNDLVTWTQLPIALIPEEELCFSGSAIEVEGTLVLMYTAHKNNKYSFNETQYLAFSNDGVVFNKYVKNPVISFANNNYLDFRDSKVWRHGNWYYVVTGSRSSEYKGRVLLYKSKDMEYWEYVSEIAKNNADLGYMWECPDFFELNGRFVLLISPQGLTNKTTDRFQNQFQVGYIIGTFDYSTGNFKEEVSFQELDYGHDFYTTQTLEHEGVRYLIAWMGSWDATFPEREDGWAGAMTITRQLTLNGDRILMKPVQAIENLRGPPIFDGYLEPDNIISLNQTGELIITVNVTEDLILNIRGENDVALLILKWDMATKKVVLDRNGEIRQGEWKPILSTSWRVFLDASSIEVFCGEGEMTFTSRVYPNGMWRVVNRSVQAVNVTAYSLNRSVPL